MAEVGLLPFARVALQVARRVLPPYRSRFSKRQFTQPQLLAVLCLMRYEDWTFRETEVRLGEHRDLREVLQLPTVPDHTTLYRFLKRLDDDLIDRGLGETVRRLRRGKTHVRVSAAIDGTGLSPQAVSTYFLRRIEQHNGGKPRYRHYLKWLVVADVKQQILLAQRARQGPWCDTRALPALLDAAGQRVPVREVLADAEFDSEANHEYIRQRWRARSIIPAKPRRGIPRGGIRYQMYRAFPQKEYGQRAKIETIFSVIKRKLSTRAPGRSLPVQIRQALLLGLTYNLYRLRHRLRLRGCQQSRFKSFVLKLRIPKGLQSYFSKVRILRMLAMRDECGEKEKDNAETPRAQRFRREDGDAGRGWKPMFTVDVTATRDNLSRYLLCSNDSNGRRRGPKLIRGMGMDGNLVRGIGVCAGLGQGTYSLRERGQRKSAPSTRRPAPI